MTEGMQKIMVTGHFDPIHEDHVSYFEDALRYDGFIICLLATDEQAIAKKGHINIPATFRQNIVRLILTGMGARHCVVFNIWDQTNDTLAGALKFWRPDVLLRGKDKTSDDMPVGDGELCDQLGIAVHYSKGVAHTHGRTMKWDKEVL